MLVNLLYLQYCKLTKNRTRYHVLLIHTSTGQLDAHRKSKHHHIHITITPLMVAVVSNVPDTGTTVMWKERSNIIQLTFPGPTVKVTIATDELRQDKFQVYNN